VCFAGLLLVSCDRDPRYQGKTFSEWVAELESPDPKARALALSAMVRGPFDRKQVAALLERSLSDPDPHVRGSAAMDFLRLDPKYLPLPRLLEALQDPEPDVRGGAVMGLRQAKRVQLETVIPALLRVFVEDPDFWVQRDAADALSDCCWRSDEVVAALERAREHPDENVRREARLALERIELRRAGQ
jgi:HEAT repeat protein